jgi:cytochrome o ubiquinol oxidase subunit II
MNKRQLLQCILACSLVFSIFIMQAVQAAGLGVLSPKGIIAHQERKLMFDTLALMLIVVLPVIVMSFAFAYRYKATKRLGSYHPDWSHNTLLEAFWWGIPGVIVLVLAYIVWHKTHELDPYKTINVKGDIEEVQVVALRWKWLFIYPKEGIATINDLHLPVNKQFSFQITADSPMSSFDIPQLGGQIYAMAGMRTKLHLYTTHKGIYEGLNTQLNGDGFSMMHFKTHVVSQKAFDRWVEHVKQNSKALSLSEYKTLYEPNVGMPPVHFSSVQNDLFQKIMAQYKQKNRWLHSW